MVHKKKIIGMRDIIQETTGNLARPEIRIWVHPKAGGDDYYFVNVTMAEARSRRKRLVSSGRYNIVEHPLIAFRGYEMTVASFNKQFPKVSLV